MTPKNYTIKKRIAKHGKQSIIIIPSNLKEQLKSGTLVKITIEVLEEKHKSEYPKEVYIR